MIGGISEDELCTFTIFETAIKDGDFEVGPHVFCTIIFLSVVPIHYVLEQ